MSTKEEKKLLKLRLALNKALDNAMSVSTREKVVFGNLDPKTLDKPRQQITEFLKSNCKEEFENILHKRNIIEKLSQLDTLKQCADVLEPNDVVRASVIQAKKEELSQLNMILEHYESENAKSREIVTEKRSKVKDTMQAIKLFSLHQKENTEKLEACL